MTDKQEGLRAALLSLGFDEVRFAQTSAMDGTFLRDWLAQGRHADMAWMERTADKRLDPTLVLAGARSAILLGVNYWPGPAAGQTPEWARYAQYSDYHDTIKPALVAAGKELEARYGVSGSGYRYYVDAGPVVERGWAAKAGMGFVGNNGMMISRRFGNWLFLAALLTTVDLEPDPVPHTGTPQSIGHGCGKCTRCREACPTGALCAPGTVDARLCISYQTIENRGVIPRNLRGLIGGHIYGCDLCLEVCPWNRFAQKSRSVLLQSRPEMGALSLRQILAMDQAAFSTLFKGTAIKRIKLAGLLRNGCIVAANTRSGECLDLLIRLASHEAPVVRVHAVWAVYKLAGRAEAAAVLAAARNGETDAGVLGEYAACAAEGA